MKKKYFVSIIYIFLGLLYILGPRTLFKPCGMSDSTCQLSVKAILPISILIITIGILYSFVELNREKIFLSIVEFVAGFDILFILKVLIGGCSVKTMACNTTAFPFLYVVTFALIIVSVSSVIYQNQPKVVKDV